MKELSIEEKAKAYDETIERAKNFIKNGNERERTIAECIFAGFIEESEDERIRKELLEHCKDQAKPYIQTGNEYPQIKSWISWLEKQGEQKTAEWSEEDKEMWLDTIKYLELLDAQGIHGNKAVPCINWLKSIKDRVQLQTPYKPTEAQLVSLEIACDRNDRIGFDLTQLLKDLKKLIKQ